MAGIAGRYGAAAAQTDLMTQTGAAQVVGAERCTLGLLGEGGQSATRDGLTIAFTGELAETADVRERLTAAGQTVSSGDAELVLTAVAEWGQEAFSHLAGRYAVAVWDDARGRLLLGCDASGETMLMLAKVDGGYVVATDVATLRASGITLAADESALYRYVRYGVDPAPTQTFYAGIERVAPGGAVQLTGDGVTRWQRRSARGGAEARVVQPTPLAEIALTIAQQGHPLSSRVAAAETPRPRRAVAPRDDRAQAALAMARRAGAQVAGRVKTFLGQDADVATMLAPELHERHAEPGRVAQAGFQPTAWRENPREVFELFLSDSFFERPYFVRRAVVDAFTDWCAAPGDIDASVFWRLANAELWLRACADEQSAAAGDHATQDAPAAPDKDDVTPNEGKQLDLALPGGGTVRRYPLQTGVFGRGDDYAAKIAERVAQFADGLEGHGGDHAQTVGEGWCLFVSEKIVAISQGRSYMLWEIPVTLPARVLSRFVTRTPAGIGLGSPHTMQLAIKEAGLGRVALAAAGGAAGKVVGRRGLFYELVGHGVRAIDGPTENSLFPSNMAAKLPPAEPEEAARRISAAVREALPEGARDAFCGTVIIDANDLGRDIMGSDVPNVSHERLAEAFADNPLGQGRERTPLAVVCGL